MPTLSRTPSYVDIDFTLKGQFGKSSFRPQQREIINAALGGKDIFVQAATSFGKSLCFQLPAVIDNGITIVVSPLLSLMMNQVEALRASSINANTLSSQISPLERDRIYKDLQSGHPRTRLLYVTPELCSQLRFRDKLHVVYKQHELARIVVDEAHCISEWGHDFRRDFKLLSWFRDAFPEVPIMCLTATANDQVRRDVLATLGLNKTPDRLEIFATGAFRPNLHIEVRFTKDEDDMRLSNFVAWLRSVYDRRRQETRLSELREAGERVENVPGVIYTISRDECESLASQLRKEGIGARHFHAKLSTKEKEEVLGNWVNNVPGYDVIVATTAFGMGIDKNNVRFVVHWRIPKSFEGYYQEAGRAGRDGNAAYCFLYYSREDMERITNFVSRDRSRDSTQKNGQARVRSLHRLIEYCETTNECRHAAITSYFGEKERPACEDACDFHKDAQDLQQRYLRGLASDEYICTQRELGDFQVGALDYDEYAWDDYNH
ncbi:hypothetical protein MKZ38_007622 [Zalerion maritima]|uniref:ATP-dependent DNA helicase n=1 Tax=Zalerion maritima TaxID=339359 RepID=A0AAD5RYJ5_9PEZI|nr:hypothetical protein MKZ38_007622 [Zalerion maritima]